MSNKERRKRTPIGSIIIFILILLIASLFVSFDFAAKPRLKNLKYEYVMKDVFETKDPLVTDIAMLGAHDAFTEGIRFTSIANVNEGGIVNNKLVQIIGKGLVARMSKAQNATAEELLYAGVRYLDVRVTKIEEEYYTMHGLVSDKLEVYLEDTVNYLEDHAGEFIIFDIQHFYTENGSNRDLTKEEYEALFNKIKSVKNSANKSLLDYVFYDSSIDSLSTLKYSDVTNNRASAGVIILAKTSDFDYVYDRDGDASYSTTSYKTIRSLWHNTNSTKEMLEGINTEYEYLKENPTDGIFVVNQAQKTAFLANAKLFVSLCNWSLLDLTKGYNAKLVKDEDLFKDWLEVMPIFMVDYATSTKGDFNKLANEYIKEYNEGL